MAKTRNRTQSKRPHAAIAAQRSNHPLLYVGSLIVLVIITVTFIGTPAIGGFGGAGAGTVFGTYDGIAIEHRRGNYFDSQILQISQQRRNSGFRQDTETEARAVVRQAFQRAAYRVAVLSEAASASLAVSEERIDGELIRSGPYVVGGVFSEERYNATPASQRKVNRRLVEEQLLERQYFADLTAVHTSSQAVAFFRDMAAAERRFRVAAFNFAELPQEELQQFGADNAAQFRRIMLSRILMRDGEEAEEVARRLEDGSATFEELARLYSVDDIASGGVVGWRYSYDLERDFDGSEPVEAIFALASGEHTGVLDSRFGPVIYRADADTVAPDFETGEVMAAVQDYLQRYERGFIEDFYTAQAAQFQQTAQAAGFADAAEALGIATFESDFFPINFQNLIAVSPVRAEQSDSPVANQILQSAPYQEEFFERAFTLAPGAVSQPIVLSDRILVLELLEERAAEEATLNRAESYYPFFVTSTLDRGMNTQVFDSDRLVDEFDQGYVNFLRSLRTPVQGPPTQAAF
jgi:parvulin-like peptidyl-prolyl isomerase